MRSRQIGFHFPKVWCENKKYLRNHHLATVELQGDLQISFPVENYDILTRGTHTGKAKKIWNMTSPVCESSCGVRVVSSQKGHVFPHKLNRKTQKDLCSSVHLRMAPNIFKYTLIGRVGNRLGFNQTIGLQ